MASAEGGCVTSFLRLAGAALVFGAASLGCVRSAGPSNGESGALELSIEGSATSPDAVLATGLAFDVSVNRYDDYWQCPDLSKSLPPGATRTAGIQTCGAKPEPISLIDAHCDDDACTVVSEPDGSGAAKLRVTGPHDGPTVLHVDVKSTTSDATWGDSFALRFSTATRIAIETSYADTGNTEYASMPGATFSWCPELHDANETRLVAPLDAIAVSIGGDPGAIALEDPSTTYVEHGCTSFHASEPGTAALTFAAQALSATGSVRVADPNDIVGASLYRFTSGSGEDAGATDPSANEIGHAPDIDASPVTSIDLTLESSFVDFESVLTLKDGSRALGGAGRWISSSDETLSVIADSTQPEIASSSVSIMPLGDVIGDGTVNASFGSVNVSIPFHITR